MELKSVVHMEVKKNDRSYVFAMPVGAPFGECYDACFQVLEKIVALTQQAAEQARPKEAPEAPVSSEEPSSAEAIAS